MRAVSLLFVSVGTDHHPFDRLLGWVRDWACDHPRWELQVQHGLSADPGLGGGAGTAFAFCDHDRLQELLGLADAVVSHGGPATITEARRYGHVPVVVPRDPTLGEHVDGHQQAFARRLGAAGLVHLAQTRAEFVAALDGVTAAPPTPAQRAAGLATRAVPPGVHGVGAAVEDVVRSRPRRGAGRAHRWSVISSNTRRASSGSSPPAAD